MIEKHIYVKTVETHITHYQPSHRYIVSTQEVQGVLQDVLRVDLPGACRGCDKKEPLTHIKDMSQSFDINILSW